MVLLTVCGSYNASSTGSRRGRLSQIGVTLRPSLAPLAASPAQAHPFRLPPIYGTLWSSGRGRLKRGASVAVRSSLAGILASSFVATASPPLRVRVLRRAANGDELTSEARSGLLGATPCWSMIASDWFVRPTYSGQVDPSVLPFPSWAIAGMIVTANPRDAAAILWKTSISVSSPFSPVLDLSSRSPLDCRY